ncbi:hypothetical protein Q3G72_001001 [Acer saccharum]|nr:hypothetical protein Q3G72_001001 [Acer saccharum]
MDEQHSSSDDREPLIDIGGVHAHTTALLLSCLKWLLWTIMWLLFITWLAFIFYFPISIVDDTFADFTTLTTPPFLGIEGPVFLIYSGPVHIIAFLSVPYLLISRKQKLQEIKKMSGPKFPSYSISTFPLVVDGPLGVISAAECLGNTALCFLFCLVCWCFCCGWGGSTCWSKE